jgi:hypothetical protein
MSAQTLIDMMTSAGVSREDAERRALSYVADRDADTQLSKSMDVLEEVAQIQQDAENRHIDRLHKAHNQGEQALAATLAPALDDLLQEQRAQNEALAKGLTGVLGLVKSLRSEIAGLRDASSQIQKKAPLVKSVSYIPSPNEEPTSGASREDLFKALSLTAADKPERASELMQAAALLESGADPSTVAQRFNL